LAGIFEHGDEPWDSVKGREVLDYVSNCYFHKKGSVPWSYGMFMVSVLENFR
jgi:hypothetical protein